LVLFVIIKILSDILGKHLEVNLCLVLYKLFMS